MYMLNILHIYILINQNGGKSQLPIGNIFEKTLIQKSYVETMVKII